MELRYNKPVKIRLLTDRQKAGLRVQKFLDEYVRTHIAGEVSPRQGVNFTHRIVNQLVESPPLRAAMHEHARAGNLNARFIVKLVDERRKLLRQRLKKR